MNKYYIGIDNGFNGAITVIDDDGKLIITFKMPIMKITGSKNEYDTVEMLNIFSTIKGFNIIDKKEILIAIEKSSPQAIQSKKAIFSMAYSYGLMIGMMETMKIPYIVVDPKIWQKKIFEGQNVDNTKLAGYNFCRRMYPDKDFKKTERCKNFDDGITDSICISHYAKIVHGK